MDGKKSIHLASMMSDAAIVLVLASLTSNLLVQQVVCNPAQNFVDLYNQALKLESAEMLMHGDQQSQPDSERIKLLFFFAKEEKSDFCKRQSEDIEYTLAQFTPQAYEWIEDAKASKSWMTNLFRGASPLSQMKNLAKSVGLLGPLVNRYEVQAKNGQLTKIDVDCDIIRVQVKNLHTIMFVLSTDVKYLVIEDPRVLNGAIFDKLQSQKLSASKSFYEMFHVSKTRRAVLEEFFMNHIDTSRLNVGMVVDHVVDPSEYILGRLLDSCQAVELYQENWRNLESEYRSVCSQSKADPKGHLFETSFPFDKYNDTFQFCVRFLDSLTPDELGPDRI